MFDKLRFALRARHYSPRTERAYVGWLERFIAFHGRRHPETLGHDEVRAFLNDLLRRKVSASTHQQALCAITFAYTHAFERASPWVEQLARPSRTQRVPTVLRREEMHAILGQMRGVPRLMASLMYGSGLRLLECATLRIKDIDFGALQITVRDGKGRKDRRTLLPQRLVRELRAHVNKVRDLYDGDIAEGAGYVELPGALPRKLVAAEREWPWQWLFPATRQYRDARGSCVVTTSTKRSSSAPFARRAKRPSTTSTQRATRCATALPPTSSKRATTSAPSKSCSATATSPPPWSTPTSSTAAPSASAAPSTNPAAALITQPRRRHYPAKPTDPLPPKTPHFANLSSASHPLTLRQARSPNTSWADQRDARPGADSQVEDPGQRRPA